MGKIWMPGGGGGADLDVVTAGKPDVLAGKVIVDKDGEPLNGTMVNRGAVSQALGVNGTYIIPEGYHNGSGKVMQNIPIQGADITGTDRAWSQGMSNWAGTINLKVRNGHYLNGVNWIQQDVPEYQPWNIKKGVNIGGVVGTFEGYVPTSTDLYYRGNNIIGWTSGGGWSFQAGQISVSGADNAGKGTFNMVGKSYLNIEGSTNGNAGGTSDQSWTLERYDAGWKKIGSVSWREFGYYVKSINVANAQMSGDFRLTGRFTADTIFRIWLS